MIDTTTGNRTRERRFDDAYRHDYSREAEPTGAPSIGSLLKTLSRQSSTLIREEVALARAEMMEKIDVARASALRATVGAGLLIASVLLVVFAVNRGLTALLTPPLGLGTAVWLSPLVLALVVGLVAWAMIRSAATSIRDEGIVPHKTVDTLKEDRDWAEERIRA